MINRNKLFSLNICYFCYFFCCQMLPCNLWCKYKTMFIIIVIIYDHTIDIIILLLLFLLLFVSKCCLPIFLYKNILNCYKFFSNKIKILFIKNQTMETISFKKTGFSKTFFGFPKMDILKCPKSIFEKNFWKIILGIY